MKPILATALIVATVVGATAASSQLLKAQQKAPAPAAQAKGAPATAVGPTILGGPGVATCSQWLSVRASGAGQAEGAAWISGFLTAVNYMGADPSRNISSGADGAALSDGLDTDCRANPNDRVANVLWRGVADMMRRKGYAVSSLGSGPPLPKLR